MLRCQTGDEVLGGSTYKSSVGTANLTYKDSSQISLYSLPLLGFPLPITSAFPALKSNFSILSTPCRYLSVFVLVVVFGLA